MPAILNQKTWGTFAKSVSGDKHDPNEYVPASIERFMIEMKDYVISVKNVRPQFRALNTVNTISFKTEAQRQEYMKAYETFLMQKAKIEAKAAKSGVVGNMKFQILVEQLKFRQAAEIIKVEDIVDAMYAAYLAGQAPVASLNFKPSIAKGTKILHDKYGIPRDMISLIWGGGNTAMSKKRKDKLDIKKKIEANDMLSSLFEDAGIDMMDLGLGSIEEARTVVIDETLRLGPQSKEERQREIDRFQKGKSLFCFFTFKSGGVGLSLHHSDELTTHWDTDKPGYAQWKEHIDIWNAKQSPQNRVKPGKVRRKESGYAYEEDIPFIPTRQRVLFCATTYSAMELVQALGRCPRLTSLTDTPQTIIFYRGTIEERVAQIVSLKLRCLRKAVQAREDWEVVIVGGFEKDDANAAPRQITEGERAFTKIENDEDDDGGFIDVGGEDEGE